MKNTIKFLALGLMVFAFGAISATSALAQATAEECTATYQKFLDNRKGPEIAKLETAVAAGKEYLAKCSEIPDTTDVKDYVTKQLPKVQEKLTAAIDDRDLYQPISAALQAKDWAKVFSLGKQIIAKNPNDLDEMLVLATVGLDNVTANPPVDTYNTDTINMAKMALQKIAENKPSSTGLYGTHLKQYTYKTDSCSDGKVNATGWMNYTIGYITYYRLKNQKDALPYLYKASQIGCETKDMANIYRMIGAWYIDEFKRIDDERVAKVKAAGDQDTDETKAMFNLQKGYMERIAESYARAYKIASADKTATAEFKNSLLNRSKEFYGYRFNKVMTGYDAWVATLNTKPFTDPATAVVPVVEEVPATTTAPTGATAMTSDSTSTPTTTDTRPRTAATTTTKTAATTPATGTTTTPAATTKTATKKAPAKKPAKKKGAR